MPPVEKEQSSLESQSTSRATSATSTKRPIGMRDMMSARRSAEISLAIAVSAAAGVTAVTMMPCCAASLATLLVRAIRPAFEAD